MRIMSTKLAQKTPRAGWRTSDQQSPQKNQSEIGTEAIAGVILATPGLGLGPSPSKSGDTNGGRLETATIAGAPAGHVPDGIYVFASNSQPTDPLGTEIAGIAKLLSIQFGSQLHPHLGTGVRAGWIVVGAISLLNRAKTGTVPWHEVVLEGGGLAIDAFAAANATLPDDVQVSSDWAEGASLLVEATQHAADGGDGNQFVMEKWLDQSIPIECTRKLLSLAMVAQNTDSKYSFLTTNPIDIHVRH